MSKESKALEKIKNLPMKEQYKCDCNGGFTYYTVNDNYDKEIKTIKSALEDYEQIKKLFENYDIEFNLVNVRHAVFTLAQLKGEHGANWDNYNKKLKALEIVEEKNVNCYLIKQCRNVREYNKCLIDHGCGIVGARHCTLTKKEFDSVKEVFKK